MESAKFDRKITLQRRASTQDAAGAPVLTWQTLAVVWTIKRDVSDSERVASAEVSAEIGTRFQIRWDSSWSTLNPKDRVVSAGLIYDIVGVKEIGRREGLEISAIARADQYDAAPLELPMLDFSSALNSQYIGQVV